MFETLKPPRHAARLAIALVFAVTAPANAQAPANTQAPADTQAPAPQPVASTPPTHAGAPARKVDESALRYYAASGQTARAQAELQRLRRLYPNWAPPDLDYAQATPGGEDEQDLWDLYGADKLDELREAIAERRKAEPGWEPSPDLRAKLAGKLFRNQILGLAGKQRYGEIVQALKDSGASLEGVDIDVLWAIAEAYHRSRQDADALTVYETILDHESNAQLRLTTVKKAMSSLRMDEVERLLAMARKDSAGHGEFDSLAPDIARARIAAFLHDERLEQVDSRDLKIFGEFASAASDPNQPGLLGWYYYKLKVYSSALDWFNFALSRGGDSMVAHGLALSLRWLGRKRETEEVAYAWRKPLVNNSILFIDTLETDLTKPIPPYIEPERLTRYGETTLASASGEGAQALAWYSYNSCQFDAALRWFERAVAWRPKEATVYGYVLTLMRMNKRRDAIQLINRYDGLFPKVVELLFPDAAPKPPTPCESWDPGRRWTSVETARPAATRPPGSYVRDPARQYVWGRVAAPDDSTSGRGLRAYAPKISRSEFPIRVGPENALRFAPVEQPLAINAPVGADPAAASGGFAPEPFPEGVPLVARCVPGVGRMPYERYGFALLPAYNGVTTASAPTAAEQLAPAGTLWASERGDQTPGEQFTQPAGLPQATAVSAPIGAPATPPGGVPPLRNAPSATDPAIAAPPPIVLPTPAAPSFGSPPQRNG